MRRVLRVTAALAAGVAGGLGATAVPAHAADTVWLCRPPADPGPCRDSLQTTVQRADGTTRTVDPGFPARPKVDCFYVYPTVSGQPTTNATLAKDPEVVAIAHYQAERFSEQCRVFAPVYRQLTLNSIFAGDAAARAQGAALAYSDVLAAWRAYLAKDNRGRGVVLIGHSQGSFMLRALLRNEIDRKPAQRKRLVSALLLGGNVLVRKGKDAGGDFRHVPACRAARQTGCVIAYSTFGEPAPPADSRFGRTPTTDPGNGLPVRLQVRGAVHEPGRPHPQPRVDVHEPPAHGALPRHARRRPAGPLRRAAPDRLDALAAARRPLQRPLRLAGWARTTCT